jgi:hypothetical protein
MKRLLGTGPASGMYSRMPPSWPPSCSRATGRGADWARRPARSGPVLLVQGEGDIAEPGTGNLHPLPAIGRLGSRGDVGQSRVQLGQFALLPRSQLPYHGNQSARSLSARISSGPRVGKHRLKHPERQPGSVVQYAT